MRVGKLKAEEIARVAEWVLVRVLGVGHSIWKGDLDWRHRRH
jgi:hypothetical protein